MDADTVFQIQFIACPGAPDTTVSDLIFVSGPQSKKQTVLGVQIHRPVEILFFYTFNVSDTNFSSSALAPRIQCIRGTAATWRLKTLRPDKSKPKRYAFFYKCEPGFYEPYKKKYEAKRI